MTAGGVVQDVIRIPCQLSALYPLRRTVRELADAAGLSSRTVDDLVLAVSEASTNAVRYGCPTPDSHVEVRWKTEGGCLEVEVADEGVFRKRVPLAGVDDSRGRGIPLMIALMDEVHIREGTPKSPGTVVRMVKCRER